MCWISGGSIRPRSTSDASDSGLASLRGRPPMQATPGLEPSEVDLRCLGLRARIPPRSTSDASDPGLGAVRGRPLMPRTPGSDPSEVDLRCIRPRARIPPRSTSDAFDPGLGSLQRTKITERDCRSRAAHSSAPRAWSECPSHRRFALSRSSISCAIVLLNANSSITRNHTATMLRTNTKEAERRPTPTSKSVGTSMLPCQDGPA
jgi:hypothetical protein